MRALSAFFLLSLLFLFGDLGDARKDPADYWKNMMKGEPMPKAIEELVHGEYPSSDLSKGQYHFNKDFDTKPNAIIYHSHVEPKKVKPLVKDFKVGQET